MTDPGSPPPPDSPPPAPPARSPSPATTLRRVLTAVPVALALALFVLSVAGALPGLWTLRRTGLGIEGAGVIELESGPEEPSPVAAPTLPSAPKPEAVATAAQIWVTTCASCHGPAGVPTSLGRQVGAADLSAPAVQDKTDAELRGIILDGRGRMLPYRGRLTDVQVDELVRHLRTLKGSGEN